MIKLDENDDFWKHFFKHPKKHTILIWKDLKNFLNI